MDFLTNLAERRPVEDEEDFWQINSIEFQSWQMHEHEISDFLGTICR
jgi:hypothetical protein